MIMMTPDNPLTFYKKVKTGLTVLMAPYRPLVCKFLGKFQ